MIGTTLHRLKAITIAIGILTYCLPALSSASQSQKWTVSHAAPPQGITILLPDPEGRVTLAIQGEGAAAGEKITLSINPFWSDSGDQVIVRYDDEPAGKEKTRVVRPGQPFTLKLVGQPDGHFVWGSLGLSSNKEISNKAADKAADKADVLSTLPLVLGHVGPVVDGDKQSVPAFGRGRLFIRMDRYGLYGPSARFTLLPFQSGGEERRVSFVDPVSGELTGSIDVKLPTEQGGVSLEIDAGSLDIGEEYTGALRTVIGKRAFHDTSIKLQRKKWEQSAGFGKVPDARGKIENAEGKGSLRLVLEAAGDQPLYGITVSSDTPTKEGFDPRNDLDVVLQSKGKSHSLWTFDAADREQFEARTVQPGEQVEVIVEPRRELAPGTYEATLEFDALNVDSTKRESAIVTFTVKNTPLWAILILVTGVLISYATSRGIGAALHRRNLRRRINSIRRTSWLVRDRWSPLPVVRAYARIAMADRAMRERSGLKRLARFVTAPDLIDSEVKEVENRLPVLERLNRLAIYWYAAPMTTGHRAIDVHPIIIRRAQKILRNLVGRLSTLGEKEELGRDIVSEIEALEGWENRELMQAGYWANLHADIQKLLDAVRIDQFESDEKAYTQLLERLEQAECQAGDDDLVKALGEAVRAARAMDSQGLRGVHEALQPVLEKVPGDSAHLINDSLTRLESTEREIVRRLKETIEAAESPASLNAMTRLEENYARLKLILELRNEVEKKNHIFGMIRSERPIEEIFEWVDDQVWKLLKEEGAVSICPVGYGGTVEAYELIDFTMMCNNQKANRFLFKHGLEFEWVIKYDAKRKPLTPITRSTTVTQFIPKVARGITVDLKMRYGDETKEIPQAIFDTIATSRFRDLWPVPTVELIGIGVALVLALVAGLQTDAFSNALTGSWKEYLTLFAWGVGADQTRNLLKNLDAITKGEGAVVN
ncbi:MAG: hypothetical protein ABW168_03050 [Sedimenticola sp.]